ncbi:MAG: extracellular solute-binding protein [Faecalibacterium sp.]
MKKITRRSFLQLAGATAVASAAAACSSDSTTTTSTSTTTSSAATDSADDASADVSGTIILLGESINVLAITAAMEKYLETHPNVDFESISMTDTTELNTTMTAKIGANDLPDMMCCQVSSTLVEYATNGYLTPITSWGVQDTIIDGETTLMEYNGETYANPMTFTTTGVIVNCDTMDMYGVDYYPAPHCMEDFLAKCQELQDAGLASPIVLAGKETSPSTAFVFQYVYQNVYGDEPNWYAKVLRGEMFWNGPEFMSTYDAYEKLIPYLNSDMLGMDSDGARRDFITNEAAFYIDGNTSLATLRNLDETLNMTFYAPPFAETEDKMSAVTSFDAAVCVSSTTESLAACEDFYKYLFSVEGYMLAAEASTLTPTVAEAAEFIESDPALANMLSELADGMAASAMLSREWIDGIKEVMKDGSQNFLAGMSIQEVCDTIESEHQRLMAANPEYVESFLASYVDV